MVAKAAGVLFNQKTVKKAQKGFSFPADLTDRHRVIQKWITSLSSGKLTKVKEVSLHGQFLSDIFQVVLGYRSIVDSDRWELHAEKTIADGGGSADGAVGLFYAQVKKSGNVKLQGRVVAPIELKGVTNDLDRTVSGRHESAVDQGWRYANYTPDCQWVIVSNYREIRLYQTSKTPAYYERFLLENLADLSNFQRFYFILCRENFLPNTPNAKDQSQTDQLLTESARADKDISEQLYKDYKQVRLALAKHFLHIGPEGLGDRNLVLIAAAQKVLDRVLFVAFCEDRGLLPEETLRKAYDHKDPYNPRTIWENYKAVFEAVDKGNSSLSISGYNGGLFAYDTLLDGELQVSDVLCTQLSKLTEYDFASEVSVNILGHIFEQSVSDLEELRAKATNQKFNKKKGKRKTQGVYYTPEYITQYIVEIALGEYLKRKESALWDEIGIDQIRSNATRQRRSAEIQFWERYRDEVLVQTRVIDPACGSGAFLIAAFDFLSRKYEEVNERLAALRTEDELGEYVGQRSLFDLTKTILNQNLYGVDLSPESVEITKLSLWLKTAERGKALTYLDDNIQVGNSIIDNSEVDPYAFDWERAFPEVFSDGGFDVVIGNPPYVRQELLAPFKAYLQKYYDTYDGKADIYVYFYEKGLNILRPSGALSYIVTNKWLRAGYGEPLRKFFSEKGLLKLIVDFGHAPIFEDADVFPCIVSVNKPDDISREERELKAVQVCTVPREQLKDINLPQYINRKSYEVPWTRYGKDEWSLEPPAAEGLMNKLKAVGIRLEDFIGASPVYGLKTGYNTAFLIDQKTRDKIVARDPQSTQIIKPYFRGEDVGRWNSEWQSRWMILATPDIDIASYTGVKEHLLKHKERLSARAGKQKWWQLQSMPAHYEIFEKAKIVYQEIQFHPSYCYDTKGYYTNNKCFILPTQDLFTLAVLNSPIGWWHNWRYLPHMKDEALSPKGKLMIDFPIPAPTDIIRSEVELAAQRLIEFSRKNQEANHDVHNWLQLEYSVGKLGGKLDDFSSLSLDEFLQEVKERRHKDAGSLSPKSVKELRDAYNDYALPIQSRRAEGLILERRISDLINQAYSLTLEEVDLVWKTAPPRMPF